MNIENPFHIDIDKIPEAKPITITVIGEPYTDSPMRDNSFTTCYIFCCKIIYKLLIFLLGAICCFGFLFFLSGLPFE